jgi:hypothetical protein
VITIPTCAALDAAARTGARERRAGTTGLMAETVEESRSRTAADAGLAGCASASSTCA